MTIEKRDVVIIGGGITGLTAAYYLQQEAEKRNLPINVKLIEATIRLGGKIQTVFQDGFTIEKGPDSFLAQNKSAVRLISSLGLEKELVHSATGTSYVLVNNKLYSIPEGTLMGVPTTIKPFITSDLLSVPGKIRAAADFILPRSKVKGDQSVGYFFRRRLGDEVVDNLIDPLLSGVHTGDIDQLSLKSTFPHFLEMEQQYRSLIAGMKKTAPVSINQNKKGMFLTLKSGLQSIVDTLEDGFLPNTVLKGVRVELIEKREKKYQVVLNNGAVLYADSIITCVSHQMLPSLFPTYNFFTPFKHIPLTSVATVVMAFPENAIRKNIEGTDFFVSRNGDYTITACTWTHKKWPHTTPKGKVLLRCYVGRTNNEAIVDLSDEEIEQIVLEDLNKIIDIGSNPAFTIVTRWKDAMPQYSVGHKDRVDQLKNDVNTALPGVFVTGSSFEGIGIPDCIEQGEKVVQQVLQYLNISE
ncbi:protoporphyrinogen oxidase [Bacillus chungangensis]|uniref:Coproporphyrinogen III oxidase n=1 Tax=Bacillus chungangensis TaxID=587633 RepID=A0ABT9WNB2_9BACI|nr:protoporphyrinogen oxidase [Bacillus chungangensis]MDQ0174774.1 oxygen-dependent protoporphyrinogen oxidase [Bacillus chungangensis]